MDWKLIGTVFASVFVAELGDKTQLSTMLFAAKNDGAKLQVFLGAAAALVVSTAIGVLAGQAITAVVSEQALKWIAGIGFVAIGLWTLFSA
jgi:putative Ca2+/H+ antiporter (TMEM165/GDT1 family)